MKLVCSFAAMCIEISASSIFNLVEKNVKYIKTTLNWDMTVFHWATNYSTNVQKKKTTDVQTLYIFLNTRFFHHLLTFSISLDFSLAVLKLFGLVINVNWLLTIWFGNLSKHFVNAWLLSLLFEFIFLSMWNLVSSFSQRLLSSGHLNSSCTCVLQKIYCIYIA